MEALSEGWTVEGKATMEEKPGRQTIGRKPATVDSPQGVAVSCNFIPILARKTSTSNDF